jgi:hypothetical protein
MGMTERRKGERAEREIVELLHAHGWSRATRNFQSGGQGNGDIAHGPEGTSWEVKRSERFRLRDAYRQAAIAAKGDIPVVATRWNDGPWLAVIELSELLVLLRLREREP